MLSAAGAAGATVTVAALAADPIIAAVRDVVLFNLTQIGLKPTAVAWTAADVPKHLSTGTTGGLWVNVVSSGSLSPASMALTLLPYLTTQNASNVTDPKYAQLATAAQDATAKSNAAFAKYVIDQAFHLTMVSTQDPLVTAKSLRGVSLDANGYLELQDAK
jgi:hypothetical protein